MVVVLEFLVLQSLPPDSLDASISAVVNTPYTFTPGNFPFISPGSHGFAGVQISTLPTHGSMTLNGAAVTQGQLITIADITAGKLQFTGEANTIGPGYASFQFQVQDDFGTAASRQDLDPTPNTLTINVTEPPSLAVTTLDDVVDAFDGQTSLREAIAFANSNADASTVTFASGLSGGTLRLTGLGTLEVTQALTIDGDSNNDGTADITITGDVNGDDTHQAGSTILTDVAATQTAGHLTDNVQLIHSVAAITVDGLVLTGGNAAAAPGGAIGTLDSAFNTYDVTVSNSIISGNTAGINFGGGILGAAVGVNGSTISNNSAGFGGGIAGTNGVTVNNSTISGNTALLYGGGIVSAGTATLTNTTLAYNTAEHAGGIDIEHWSGPAPTLVLVNSTVTGNRATVFGQGISAAYGFDSGAGAGPVEMTNSIMLGNNSHGPVTAQTPVFHGTNIYEGIGGQTQNNLYVDSQVPSGSVTASQVFGQTVQILALQQGGTAPVLAGVLADNGGPVQTVALLASITNPALDASNNSGTATDARGTAATDIPGIDNNGSATSLRDLGAFEAVDPTSVTATPVLTSIAENTSTATAIKFSDLTVVDPFNEVTLALSGADGSLFEIQSGGIFLKAGSVLDFETNPQLDVTLTVNRVGAAPLVSAATFLVTDVNEAPTAVVLGNPVTSLAENTSTAAHIKVADIAVTDDALGTNALSLTGADASAFEIVAGALYLKAGTVLDFETKSSFNVTVKADDSSAGGTPDASKAFTLNVTDVNEAPTAITFTNIKTAIVESASTALRTKIADITVTDDALGSETITLAGADAAKFEIFGGDLYLKAGAVLDFETNPKLDVTVNVNDPAVGGAVDVSKALSISVTDVIDVITGTPNPDTLIGGSGADRILGLASKDTISGGGGNDTITGGGGADKMTGGTGADVFVFTSVSDSPSGTSSSIPSTGAIYQQSGVGVRDVITDFAPGTDKIDLHFIDANTSVAGNQAFTFLGTGILPSTPGGLVYRKFDFAGTTNDKTMIFGDVNGDQRVDFQIELTGLRALAASDFLL